MDDSTWEQGKFVGGVAAALAALKWIFGRSRVATVDEKYARLADQIEELERKMNDQLRDIRSDLAQTQGKVQRVEDDAHEQRLKVMRTIDEMQTTIQLGFRSIRAALGASGPEMPPSRQV